MSNPTSPHHDRFVLQLPADTHYQLVHTLSLTLPPPLTDGPEDLARRDHSAISRIAALHPANAAEADIAALYVAASEQWKQCLHFAQQSDPTTYWAQKCRAQANSMMRQSQSALRLLLRMQAAREKLEADSGARDRAATAEQRAIDLMAQAPPAPQAPSPCGTALREGAAPITHDATPTGDTSISSKRAAMIRLLKRLKDPDDDLAQTLIDLDLAAPGGLRFSPGGGTNGASLSGVHTDHHEG